MGLPLGDERLMHCSPFWLALGLTKQVLACIFPVWGFPIKLREVAVHSRAATGNLGSAWAIALGRQSKERNAHGQDGTLDDVLGDVLADVLGGMLGGKCLTPCSTPCSM